MPYHVESHGDEFWVVGPRKGKARHVYGKHGSRKGAVRQIAAIEAQEARRGKT